MAPSTISPLLLFLLIASTSAKTTISFYQKALCASDSPSAGDAFRNDNLAASSRICYKPPDNTLALKVEEIDEGCSITAYLDSTCSMPTSEALTTTKSPCYFLGPSNYIGSFKAKCSSTATNESSATAAEKGSSSTSPGLQSTPSNGAGGLTASGAMGTGGRWLEPGIRALMSMGAVEVAWGWDML